MRQLIFAAAGLLLLVACTTTAAAPQPEMSVAGITVDLEAEAPPESPIRIVEFIEAQTYSVGGETASAIRAELNRGGPYSAIDGRTYDATTRWGMQWSFRYQSEAGSCRLAAATIEVVAVTMLPELRDPTRLNPQTRARWQAYIEAVTAHEAGHVEGVLRGARALQAAMHDAPPMPSCGELGAHLGALGDAYVEAIGALDLAYDAETGHGRSQGAIFP